MLRITGKLRPIKPVLYGILYFLPRSVYYFSSYLLRKVTFFYRPAGGKIYFPPGYEEKSLFDATIHWNRRLQAKFSCKFPIKELSDPANFVYAAQSLKRRPSNPQVYGWYLQKYLTSSAWGGSYAAHHAA